MPDAFIPSMNLEVEIKDDGSALNINAESREKDKIYSFNWTIHLLNPLKSSLLIVCESLSIGKVD